MQKIKSKQKSTDEWKRRHHPANGWEGDKIHGTGDHNEGMDKRISTQSS